MSYVTAIPNTRLLQACRVNLQYPASVCAELSLSNNSVAQLKTQKYVANIQGLNSNVMVTDN